jgi:hypothetical protein
VLDGGRFTEQRRRRRRNQIKEVEAMRTRWRFLQLLLIGAALAGVFIIQAGSPSAGVLTHPEQHQ